MLVSNYQMTLDFLNLFFCENVKILSLYVQRCYGYCYVLLPNM